MAAGFMAGFGTTMSKLIEDDREYYRELATKKRDYLQTYGTKAVLDRDEKANGAVSLFNNLVTAGIPQDDLRYVLDTTGVSGLAELKSTLSTRDDLTPAQIKGLVEKSKDYVAENPNEDITEVMRRAYGLYKSTDNPVEQETNMFAAVLGLDSRMMEREALNDVYIDGFKGTDLYAIMARGGPKPGEALSLNLPTKPPSTSEIKLGYESLQNRFEQTIDAKIKALTQSQSGDDTDVEAARIVADIKALNDLKGRGVLGYAKLGEIDPTFMEYAKGLEETRPGIITRNPTMIEFGSAYTSYWGDQEDDAVMDAAGGQGTGDGGPTPPGPTPNAYTPTELRAALAANEIEVGAKVEVNGNVVTVTKTQIDKAKVETGKDLSTSTEDEAALQRREVALNDLDLSVPTPGLTDDDMGLPDGPIPKSLIPDIQAGAETMEWIVATTDSEAFDTSVLSNALKLSAAAQNGTARAIDFLTGIVGGTEETGVSKSLKSASKYQLEQAAEVAAKGFTEYWTSDLEDGDGFKPEFPGDVPEGVVKEVKGSYLDAIMDMLGMGESSETKMVNGTPMTDAEILAAARAQLDAEVLKRVEEAHRAKVLRQQAMNEGVRVLPESPGDVPDNLEDATTESISKSLRFLTELPERIHQSLFDTQDKINASIAALFEETLEERIMKNEGQRNRVVALQALKDKISDLRKEAEVEQTVEPEPLVTRPKKPLKPKGMTASDKARLQRAQKANELSGDSGLLEMLVEKYGIALVQKEMGL